MAAYNEEQGLRRAATSILSQTFEDFEFIIVDDGSTDRTWQLVEELDDPRVRGFSPGRLGLCRALNYGLSFARGEYIARMDADDRSLPGRFTRQVEFLDANPDVAILGTTYY